MSLSYLGDRKGHHGQEDRRGDQGADVLHVGDMIGVRGPYGHGYTYPKGKILVVGGGTGMASLLPALERIAAADGRRGHRRQEREGAAVRGTRRQRRLRNVRISTDDGSKGFQGNAVQLAKEMMAETKYDLVIGCGPEKMLYYLLQLCKKRKCPARCRWSAT